ncbi:MAG TPA: SUMF1/EgtB/PvdO family nonheme iron enzyme [Armatimonadota bacterium]|nr:SUMF1/EgtB/PvdO family nonheme iron enzyme [Armatimonadota bacterium]
MALTHETTIPNPAITRFNAKDGAVEIYIPPGEFTMGDADSDDTAPHKVYLSGYWIYKTPFIVDMYRKFCAETGRTLPPAPEWGWKEDHRVVNVTWHDAKAYCDWSGIAPPTEAQWEKAARGADGRTYPWGNDWDKSAVRSDDDFDNGSASAAPVGRFPEGASPYGCLDMAGNVLQWCADWYEENYYESGQEHDPTGPASGEDRVIRGCSWITNCESDFRCGSRYYDDPGGCSANLGFRGAARAGS